MHNCFHQILAAKRKDPNSDTSSLEKQICPIRNPIAKHLALDNRIRNYLKRYDNQVSIDLLDTLAILSDNLIKNEMPQKSPEPVLWFGWHAE